MSNDGPLCPDCLRASHVCECPRCNKCGELEDYCKCDPYDGQSEPFEFDDDSDNLEDKEDV